jgi:hypothetical protein
MRTLLLSLLILSIPIHGFNSIVLKMIAEIKSGLKYWRETSKK